MTGTRIASTKGFTLIELLVVIAIIGVLSGIVFSGINNARAKARDTQRIAEIRSIMNALELYRSTNGSYLVSGNCGATVPNSAWCNSVQSLSNDHWIRNGTTNLSQFISKDPIDPQQGSTAVFGGATYSYYSPSGGAWYMIVYRLENPNKKLEDIDGIKSCTGTTYHYGNGTNGILTVGTSCI